MTSVSWFPVGGVRLGTARAGIKYPDRRDLVIMELSPQSTVAGVFTRNRFQAAPVHVARENLQAGPPRYLLINTGYANAGTGDIGERNCRRTCDILAGETGCEARQVLPFSTGVIGEQFPLPAFERGIPLALANLDEHGWGEAAEGIMTTDTRPKLFSQRVEVDGRTLTVTGMAKGAGMIKPNMGTMLGFVATDAGVDAGLLNRWLGQLSDATFNAITVDGDTSTNDACMLVATGESGVEAGDGSAAAELLYAALEQVFMQLAQALVRDAEGATKFVEIAVHDAASESDARAVAETIAHSPLVKTALFASDPNWGRILAAIGRAPIDSLDVSAVQIWLGGVQIVRDGGVSPDYREADGAAVMAETDITISVSLGQGDVSARVWTCDFSYDYVRINAEYRT